MATPAPHPVRRAVIDVGTNSVKLLVADVTGRAIAPVLEESEQTRLGTGSFKTHQLQKSVIAETAQAVASFLARAREAGVATPRVVATSAARDASNPVDLTGAIQQAAGLKVEILSGEQEADWVFQGVTSDPNLASQPLLLLDVGGGSTEFILGQGDHKHFRQSFQIGTVRLLEQLPHSDPPTPRELAAGRKWVADFLEREVRPKLQWTDHSENHPAYQGRAVQLVGCGGTATILARMEARLEGYDRDRIEAVRLTRARVTAQMEHLWHLPLAEREQIVGLPKKRADVILYGTAIYEGVLQTFGFSELRVSTRGLRFAAVMDGC
jgi:exopolyphosphatase / guanosine-5'-triphosphate,3'-diphosphate pyrophosphatase